ncbi:Baculoviral IAP repeat-containing protein 1a [Rhynchospora pubera]|uniref:Baculoviral IAP repeat-containing protein 1a n=1 Tax=Rhynchospora pubera TaxID=906938 RepID=A0AAV8H4B4_9POAL|nr:Baculoviral IAP repeat-containing protein 1a [Rhynchospora pubera]
MEPSDPSKDRSEEEEEEEQKEAQGERQRGDQRRTKRSLRILIRCFLSFSFSVVGSFLFSLLIGIAALSIGNLSASTSVSVPSTCKILSSSVDIRSSKICELGLLNYKTKHVLYPSEKRRFQCHDDYYWASIFQVEYKEYFSGQTFQAVAEAPKEALPHYCRPDFSTAWLAQSKFKVNETYNCRYTLGNWKADIYSDNKLFNCQAEEPSLIELIRRLSILFIQSSLSYNVGTLQMLRYTFVGVVTGILSGALVSIIGAFFLRSIQRLSLCISNKNGIGRAFATRLWRIGLFVAYFSVLGWITIQYSRFIGLKKLVLGFGLKDWLI